MHASAQGGDAMVLADTAVVLAGVRKAKSEAKTSMRTDVPVAVVRGPADAHCPGQAGGRADLSATGRIEDLRFEEGGDTLTVDVSL